MKNPTEACDGCQNAVVNQLCNENLPKNPEDWVRLFETVAEKALEENNNLAPAAFARTLKKETEALAKMFPNNKQNKNMENDKLCIHPKKPCYLRNDKDECNNVGIRAQFCKYNTEKTAEKTEERVNHPEHYQHPSGVECITVARHHDFNIGNALKYLWIAGLKQEQGISPLDKQIEDLQKAAFYIQDEIEFLKSKQ